MTTNTYKQEPMLTPNQLYPIVHEIADDQFNNKSGFNSCGESFGGLQLNDLAPFWNSLCPCEANHSDDGEQQQGVTSHPNENALTPIKTNCHKKEDSMSTLAISEADLPEEGSRQEKATSTSKSTPRTPQHRSRHRRRHNKSASETALVESTFHNDYNHDRKDNERRGPMTCSSPGRKRSHFRKGSRQLMNMLFVRSHSISSSTKDPSIAETSMESQVLCHEEETIRDRYILTLPVFQSPNSEIWECLDRETGVRFCTKSVEFPSEVDYWELDLFHSLSKDNHPSLTRLVDVFIEPSKLFMVMEWEAGGNLLSRVIQEGPLEEEKVKAITRSLLEGCLFLHSKGVVHADLQPENCLMTGRGSKICDFGSAVDLALYQPCGTQRGTGVGYSAPELLQDGRQFDTQADMWSMGCLIYFCLCGFGPFDEKPASRRKTMTRVLRAEYSFPSCHFRQVSRSAKQFICGLILTDPSVRMTAEEALEHPWLRVEEVPQEPCFRSRGSQGNGAPLLDNSLTLIGRHASTASNCSPVRKSCKKHHRRLSSLTKGISKLFSPKEASQPPQHPLKTTRQATSLDLCSSSTSLTSTDLTLPPPVSSVNSWAGQQTETPTKHHRRLVTS